MYYLIINALIINFINLCFNLQVMIKVGEKLIL